MTHTATPTATHRAHVPLVEVTRGDLVEGVHYGSFAVVDSEGRPLTSAGDIDAPFYPRSTLKPLQLLAMLRLGLDLPTELLALAAASHSGSPEHIDGARRILFDLDQGVQAVAAAQGMADPATIRLTGVYHNLLRRWADA